MILTSAIINFFVSFFCGLHIYDEIKTSFTLLFLHCRPMLKIHSTISFFVSCLLPISLQPMCSIKTSGVSSFKIGFTYVSICFWVALGVAPIAFIQFWIKFFSSNSFNHTGSYNIRSLAKFQGNIEICVASYNKCCCVLYLVMQ